MLLALDYSFVGGLLDCDGITFVGGLLVSELCSYFLFQ